MDNGYLLVAANERENVTRVNLGLGKTNREHWVEHHNLCISNSGEHETEDFSTLRICSDLLALIILELPTGVLVMQG